MGAGGNIPDMSHLLKSVTKVLFDRCNGFVAIISCTPSPPFHAQNMRRQVPLTQRGKLLIERHEVTCMTPGAGGYITDMSHSHDSVV